MRTLLPPLMQWKIKEAQHSEELAKTFKISSITARILAARKLKEEDIPLYFGGQLKDLNDPYLMKDMQKAISRLHKAHVNQEKVMVHGDYDVDGLTGTALLCDFFRRIGLNASYYIPDRFLDGYGLSEKCLEEATRLGVSVMITVDCGVNAHEIIKKARDMKIDVIVVDHHQIKEGIPQCAAVLNPKRDDCHYPFSDFSAVGVGFKLIHGLMKFAKEQGLSWSHAVDLKDFLEIAAIGTIADMVSIKGENKILVKYGLKKLEETKRPGLKALLNKCLLLDKKITTTDVAFRIAPRMNASGRMGDALDTLKLLLTHDVAEAERLAKQLDEQNKERQCVEKKTVEEANELIEKNIDLDKNWVIVLEKEGWSIGIVGIVAAKIMRQYHRPTFILAREDDLCKGSARSFPEFALHEVLKPCEDLFLSYGGHACAAGLRMEYAKVDEFRERINKIAKKMLSSEDLTPAIHIDAVLNGDEVNDRMLSELEMLEPFGQGNPAPVFLMKNLKMIQDPRIVGENHVKIKFSHQSKYFDAIAFGWKDRMALAPRECKSGEWQAVFELTENIYKGVKRYQMQIRDLIYECI